MEAFKLHPLVLVNVSDHYTRFKAQLQAGEEPAMVMGCLLGTQSGREVEIFNSFEVCACMCVCPPGRCCFFFSPACPAASSPRVARTSGYDRQRLGRCGVFF